MLRMAGLSLCLRWTFSCHRALWYDGSALLRGHGIASPILARCGRHTVGCFWRRPLRQRRCGDLTTRLLGEWFVMRLVLRRLARRHGFVLLLSRSRLTLIVGVGRGSSMLLHYRRSHIACAIIMALGSSWCRRRPLIDLAHDLFARLVIVMTTAQIALLLAARIAVAAIVSLVKR